MKYLILLTVLCGIVFFQTGCDTGSDSKSVSVTAPVLVSPANLDSNVSTAPVFSWTNAADKLEIDVNSSFTSPVHSAGVTGQEYQMPAGVLQPTHYYYWRAGTTVGGTVYWSSNINSFRTSP